MIPWKVRKDLLRTKRRAHRKAIRAAEEIGPRYKRCDLCGQEMKYGRCYNHSYDPPKRKKRLTWKQYIKPLRKKSK